MMKLLDQDLSAPNQRLFEQILMQNAAVNYEGGRYMSYDEAREITELIIGNLDGENQKGKGLFCSLSE